MIHPCPDKTIRHVALPAKHPRWDFPHHPKKRPRNNPTLPEYARIFQYKKRNTTAHLFLVLLVFAVVVSLSVAVLSFSSAILIETLSEKTSATKGVGSELANRAVTRAITPGVRSQTESTALSISPFAAIMSFSRNPPPPIALIQIIEETTDHHTTLLSPSYSPVSPEEITFDFPELPRSPSISPIPLEELEEFHSFQQSLYTPIFEEPLSLTPPPLSPTPPPLSPTPPPLSPIPEEEFLPRFEALFGPLPEEILREHFPPPPLSPIRSLSPIPEEEFFPRFEALFGPSPEEFLREHFPPPPLSPIRTLTPIPEEEFLTRLEAFCGLPSDAESSTN